MTDNWDSESGQTKFLDENGNLVGDLASLDDSEKLGHIKRELMLWLDELEKDLIEIVPIIEEFRVERQRWNLKTQENIRNLLAICGKSNNQTGGIIND